MSKGRDPRGYQRVYCPVGDPRRKYCNSGGWQYRSRLVASEALGRRLETHEHVHHGRIPPGEDGADEAPNLSVCFIELHGRAHAYAIRDAGWLPERNGLGQFTGRYVFRGLDGEELAKEWPPKEMPRFGPIVWLAGRAAAEDVPAEGWAVKRPTPEDLFPAITVRGGVSWNRPHVASRGVSTTVLHERCVEHGESVVSLAENYGMEVGDVAQAVGYELYLRKSGRRRPSWLERKVRAESAARARRPD